MKKQYYILNGDSLKDQISDTIQGEIIVARECLVDGSVKGENLTEFFRTRALFISSHYEGCSEQEYYNKTLPEFDKIQQIPADSDVHLWFEDDLFCQVNFWFVIHLLYISSRNYSIYLIRPTTHNQYGFGGLSSSELHAIYETKTPLTELDKLALLWELYKKDDLIELLKIAHELQNTYPFILPAVEAHLERIPSKDNLGRPSLSLLQIMDDLQTREFGPIFKEFSTRESIYGFGDLQVKRLFDQLNKEHLHTL